MSSSALIIVLSVVVVVLIVAIVTMVALARRKRLRERFGTEYERTVRQTGDRRTAEKDLRARERRHDDLDIREPAERERRAWAGEWNAVQERFVDQPEGAVAQADELITRVMRELGYPTQGYEDRVRDLSVAHGRTLEHYRSAHEVQARGTAGRATTEELRGAMVHYRALFDELIGTTG
ncbi:hypothetical protein ACN20G_34060 (plasmid) [Streptomyces sp. BI20]|uniref:hypothetical protein n=1 Tax=Streptomyces sp. BI20 TaxID=3403460 RepID=UPI003C770646